MKRQVTTLSPGLAKEYDSTKAYAVDDYVLYGNAYWRCKTAISSPGEEWNPDHWRKEDVLSSKADLVDGKVPAAQLPEDWNDVQEFATRESFPSTGMTGVLYVALDTNDVYRWSHSQEKYIEVGGNAAQLQADWDEDNPDSKAFIKNKPDVATIDDATLAPIITVHGVDGYVLGEQYDYPLATREQGQKADTALQGIEVNGSEVTPVDGVVSLTIPAVSDDTPSPAGTADAGTASTAARSDHVHQAETSISGGSVYVRSVEVAKAADIPTEATDIDALPATKSGSGTSEAYTVTLGTSPDEVTITLANSAGGTYLEVIPSSGFGTTRYKFGGKIQKLVGTNTWVEVQTPDESGVLALATDIYAAVQQIAPEWVANTAYADGSCVAYNGVVYQNTSGATIQDDVTPDTSGSGWTAKPVSEIFASLTDATLTPVTSGTATTGYVLGNQTDKKLATQEQGLDGVEALIQLQFAIWYPDGSVKSASDFTSGIKFDETHKDTVNLTIDVLPFCDTGSSGANDNSELAGRVVIPAYWDDPNGVRYTVVSMDNPASAPLSTQSNVTEVVLPTTIKILKANAFSGCTALKSINLNSVEEIKASAFYGCESLESVELHSATEVGSTSFGACTSLVAVDFGNSLTSVTTLGNVNAFPATAPSGCKIIVPNDLYTSWTSSANWGSLVSRGYRYLRYDEWDYARRYELEVKAPLASPTFTGEPKAPTADPGTNTTQIATTAFVKAACDAIDVSSQIAGKADKVSGATEDNFASLDNNGNLKDSGYNPSDFAAAADVAEIQDMIPPGADSSNQLADKNFVNSSIEAMAATFRGTFNLRDDLNVSVEYKDDYAVVGAAIKAYIESQYSSSSSEDIEEENNDYVFVQIPETDSSDSSGSAIVRIDRYKCTVTGSPPSQTATWMFEYSLNNSSFNSDQWDAINSGIKSGDVTKLRDLPDAITLAGALADKYEKPDDGIPATDMATGVQTALSKAGSAIQGVQVNSVDLEPDANNKVNIVIPVAAVTSVNGDTGDVVLDADDVGALPVSKVTSGGVEMYRIDLGPSSNRQYMFLAPASDGAYIAVYPQSGSYGVTTYRASGTIQKQVDGSTWVYARTPNKSGTISLLEHVAPIYNSGKSYVLGQLVVQDGTLKKCTTAGTGSAAEFEEATVQDVLSAFYATADQGSKADSAIQGITVNGTAVTVTDNVAAITVATPPSPYDNTPEAAGTASPGTASGYSRGDHRHPAETSKSGDDVYVQSIKVAKYSDVPTQASQIGALPTSGGDMTGTIAWPALDTSVNNILLDARESDGSSSDSPGTGSRIFAIRVAGDSVYLMRNTRSIEIPSKDGTMALLDDVKYDLVFRSHNPAVLLMDHTVNVIDATDMSGGALIMGMTAENTYKSRDFYIAVTCGGTPPTISISNSTLIDSLGDTADMELAANKTTVFHLTEVQNSITFPEEVAPVFVVYGGKNGGGSIDPSVLNGKADKVTGATPDNFAGLDNNGNLKDSGKSASDFATAAQGGKADSAIQGITLAGSQVTPGGDKVVNITNIPMGALANDVQAGITRSATALLSSGAAEPWDSSKAYPIYVVVTYNGKVFKSLGGDEYDEETSGIPPVPAGMPPEGNAWSEYYWKELTLVEQMAELIAPEYWSYYDYPYKYSAGELCSYKGKIYECTKTYYSGHAPDSSSSDDEDYSTTPPDQDFDHWGERDIYDLLYALRTNLENTKQDKKIGSLFQTSVGAAHNNNGNYNTGVFFNVQKLNIPPGAQLRTVVVKTRSYLGATGTFIMRIVNSDRTQILATSKPVYVSASESDYVFQFENTMTIQALTTYVIFFVKQNNQGEYDSSPSASDTFGYAVDTSVSSNPDIAIREYNNCRPVISFGLFLTVDQLKQSLMYTTETLIQTKRALVKASLYNATQTAINNTVTTAAQTAIDSVTDAATAKTALQEVQNELGNAKTAMQALFNTLVSMRSTLAPEYNT